MSWTSTAAVGSSALDAAASWSSTSFGWMWWVAPLLSGVLTPVLPSPPSYSYWLARQCSILRKSVALSSTCAARATKSVSNSCFNPFLPSPWLTLILASNLDRQRAQRAGRHGDWAQAAQVARLAAAQSAVSDAQGLDDQAGIAGKGGLHTVSSACSFLSPQTHCFISGPVGSSRLASPTNPPKYYCCYWTCVFQKCSKKININLLDWTYSLFGNWVIGIKAMVPPSIKMVFHLAN